MWLLENLKLHVGSPHISTELWWFRLVFNQKLILKPAVLELPRVLVQKTDFLTDLQIQNFRGGSRSMNTEWLLEYAWCTLNWGTAGFLSLKIKCLYFLLHLATSAVGLVSLLCGEARIPALPFRCFLRQQVREVVANSCWTKQRMEKNFNFSFRICCSHDMIQRKWGIKKEGTVDAPSSQSPSEDIVVWAGWIREAQIWTSVCLFANQNEDLGPAAALLGSLFEM